MSEGRRTAEEAEQIREGAERAAQLPKRQPGKHWTGPSGEHRHIEVPLTGRTLTNIRNWGRQIT
jgi:hypothetical protein